MHDTQDHGRLLAFPLQSSPRRIYGEKYAKLGQFEIVKKIPREIKRNQEKLTVAIRSYSMTCRTIRSA